MAAQEATGVRPILRHVENNAKAMRDGQGFSSIGFRNFVTRGSRQDTLHLEFVRRGVGSDTHHCDLVAAVFADSARLSNDG